MDYIGLLTIGDAQTWYRVAHFLTPTMLLVLVPDFLISVSG
jgi:hypothetical protein